jgi:hypothetical protein
MAIFKAMKNHLSSLLQHPPLEKFSTRISSSLGYHAYPSALPLKISQISVHLFT